jgi:hypothetical protein
MRVGLETGIGGQGGCWQVTWQEEGVTRREEGPCLGGSEEVVKVPFSLRKPLEPMYKQAS